MHAQVVTLDSAAGYSYHNNNVVLIYCIVTLVPFLTLQDQLTVH